MTEIILFFTGVLVGTMNAIAGGGMLIGFPILLATGTPAIMANATSCIIVFPGQVSALFGYRKYLRQIPKTYFLLIIPCFFGALIGTTILRNTSAESFEKLVPGLIIFAVGLFAYQPFLHTMVNRHLHGPKKHRQSIKPIIILCLAMFPVSIYGGYFGAGMGFIMLAFLGFTKLHEMHKINALKNVMTASVAVASIASLSTSGLISWEHGIPMSLGCLIGGYFGARLAQRFSSHAIRVLIITIGVSTAVYLVFHNY